MSAGVLQCIWRHIHIQDPGILLQVYPILTKALVLLLQTQCP
jgi:hypothetical protein